MNTTQRIAECKRIEKSAEQLKKIAEQNMINATRIGSEASALRATLEAKPERTKTVLSEEAKIALSSRL